MRCSAPGGRPRHLTEPLRFQILRVRFEISADDPAVERQLRCLVQSAIQPEAARSIVSYVVRRRDGAFEISRDGAVQDVQFDPAGVFKAVSRQIHRDALAAWPQAALLRAVTGHWLGERFIVVGEALWDRSRLALHLISRGADIEGDDLAILHDGVLTTYPRPLRVCGLDARLPPRSPSRDELPFLGSTPSTGSWALDLGAAGIDWRITARPVDRIVLLETNYGGQTRLHPVPRYEAARLVMSCCDPRDNVPGAIRSVARLVDGAHCCRLWLGALEEIRDIWPRSVWEPAASKPEKRSGCGRDS
jgi:hypothetical protein